MIDVYKLLEKLAVKRPIFHSEADFQHELAWLIHKEYSLAEIRLEIPSGNEDKKEHLDLLVTLNSRKIAIELKYKKTAIDIDVKGERFKLKSDSALDISRYDFIKDIIRLEKFVDRNPGSIGYAIMITNEDIFWREMKLSQNSEQFFIHEGRVLEKGKVLSWHTKASKGTTKDRDESLIVQNKNYELIWKEFSKLGDRRWEQFRVLVVKII